MVFYGLFILCCFLLDSLLSLVFPQSFLPSEMIFVPCLGLASLVLTQQHLKKVDAMLLFLIFGIFYDYFIANTQFLYMIVFAILCILSRFWAKHVMESVLECLLLAISTIFVKELIVYLVMRITHATMMSISMWLVNRLFLTLLINGILIVIIIFASRVIEDFILMREKRIRKEETVSWLNLRLRR